MASWESGSFKLSYGGSFPDNLKLIKSLSVFPLELTAMGSLNPRTQRWSYSLGCREVLLDGRITYSAARNTVQYKKVLPLPVFGGLTRPVLAAEWQLGAGALRSGAWRRPRLQIGLAVDEGGASGTADDGATLSGPAVAFRRKVFVTRRWGVEVDGDARFSFSHDVGGGDGGGVGSVANSLGLALNARELNLVCRI